MPRAHWLEGEECGGLGLSCVLHTFTDTKMNVRIKIRVLADFQVNPIIKYIESQTVHIQISVLGNKT